MTHDRLCPLIPNSCDCDLIARVREDERALHADDLREYGARGERNGYAAALRDAVEAVKALPIPTLPERYGILTPMLFRADAVAAIEGLGGER